MAKAPSRRPLILVEEDPFLRLVGIVLDPDTAAERVAAFADFFAHDEPGFLDWRRELQRKSAAIYPAEVRAVDTVEELHAGLPNARAVIVESLPFGSAEIALAPQLEAVQKFGALVRNIDVAACEAASIPVLRLRRRANIACAEHAMALLLMLARRLNSDAGVVTVKRLEAAGRPYRPFDRRHAPNSNWGRLTGVRNLNGATLGIIGLGEVGREIALRAAAFGMRIVYTQRTRVAAADEQALGATYQPLDELLARSDFLVPQLPASPATRRMLDGARLRKAKPGVIIVNVSRPDVFEREALAELLASGHIGGLALDPPFDTPTLEGDPLLGLPNVVLSPQLAGSPRANALEDFEEMILGLANAITGGTR